MVLPAAAPSYIIQGGTPSVESVSFFGNAGRLLEGTVGDYTFRTSRASYVGLGAGAMNDAFGDHLELNGTFYFRPVGDAPYCLPRHQLAVAYGFAAKVNTADATYSLNDSHSIQDMFLRIVKPEKPVAIVHFYGQGNTKVMTWKKGPCGESITADLESYFATRRFENVHLVGAALIALSPEYAPTFFHSIGGKTDIASHAHAVLTAEDASDVVHIYPADTILRDGAMRVFYPNVTTVTPPQSPAVG